MTQQDQLKVIEKGFVIIRKDEQKLQIKSKSLHNKNWKYFNIKHPSKASLDRSFKELLKNNLYISD